MILEGVILNERNLYTTYGLILAKKKIGIPERQSLILEIPGRNGVVDLSSQLYTEQKYKSLPIELKFINIEQSSSMTGAELKTELEAQFHGKTVNIVFSGDPDYFYTGICSFDNFEDANGRRVIVLSFTCDPYKYLISDKTTKVLG